MEWSESISKAINYIESHITEELTIADIAKHAIISPYYFQKGFSMLCGFTVGEYITLPATWHLARCQSLPSH